MYHKPIIKSNYAAISSFLFILFLIGCNQSAKNKTAAEVEKVKVATLARTDSAFVESYVKTAPDFKEHRDIIMKFYRERNFRLGWFKEDKLIPQANTFLDVVKRSHQDGLNPNDYNIKDINLMYSNFEKGGKEDSLKQKMKQEIDVALTASYMNYASDFYRGTVNPRKLDNIEWSVRRNKIKLDKALQTILKERDSRYPYYQFEPLHEEYSKLRTVLQQYRNARKQGGWPKIEGITKLNPGDSSQIVPVLRQRLLSKNRWKITGPNQFLYDDELVSAVKNFQVRHGLKADGSIGSGTLKQMNVPLDDRIDQLIINMERWRWVPKPKKFEEKHIFVNVPEYMLYARDKGKKVLEMKVIVGKTMNSTPVFSDKLEYIVFSPYWNVPFSIIKEEMLSKIMANPGWLERMDMEVVKGVGTKAIPVSPYDIDWGSVTKENWKYVIRQRPGPKNPLGDIKFIFPNEYEVYLHHTASESLFNATERGFSHGCVRVENPVALAEFLLTDQPDWTSNRILEAMHAGSEKYLNLKAKVPVYILYFTSWVDDSGAVHFRDDIYNHDRVLEKEYFN